MEKNHSRNRKELKQWQKRTKEADLRKSWTMN